MASSKDGAPTIPEGHNNLTVPPPSAPASPPPSSGAVTWWKRLVKSNSNANTEATSTTDHQGPTPSISSATNLPPIHENPARDSSIPSYGTSAQAPTSFTSPPPRWPALFSASTKYKESATANRKSYEDLLEEANINKEQFHLATVKIDRLQREIEWLEQHTQDRDRLLKGAKAGLNVEQRHNKALEEEMRGLKQHVNVLEAEVASLREELKGKQTSGAEAERIHAMRWRKYDELVDRLQAQVEQVVAQVELVQEEVLVKETTISMLSHNLMESQGKDEEIARLRKLLEDRDKEVESMATKLKERDTYIAGIKAGKEEVMGLLDGITEEFANL